MYKIPRFNDYATGCYYKGASKQEKTLLYSGSSYANAWLVGHTFISLDFSLLASPQSQVNDIMEGLDKQTSEYKHRIEVLLPAPEVVTAIIDRALSIGPIRTELFPGDSGHGVLQVHKVLAAIQKEFRGRSYDLLISHTTIVFSCYILPEWQHRQNTDNRTLGGLFYLLCEEISQLDWAVALTQLIALIEDVAKKANKKITVLIRTQLRQWIAGLPSYYININIKGYLPDLSRES